MSGDVKFAGVYPIGDTDTNALPVRAVGPAVGYYTRVLGFTVVEPRREESAPRAWRGQDWAGGEWRRSRTGELLLRSE